MRKGTLRSSDAVKRIDFGTNASQLPTTDAIRTLASPTRCQAIACRLSAAYLT
jgi:hypothetical protein